MTNLVSNIVCARAHFQFIYFILFLLIFFISLLLIPILQYLLILILSLFLIIMNASFSSSSSALSNFSLPAFPLFWSTSPWGYLLWISWPIHSHLWNLLLDYSIRDSKSFAFRLFCEQWFTNYTSIFAYDFNIF